jgi:periplasmic copper chaperone A
MAHFVVGPRWIVLFGTLVLAAMLAACGGGGGNPSSNQPASQPTDMPARPGAMGGEGMGGEGTGGEGMGGEGMGGMHGGSNSAAYMTLANSSDTPDALISASTDAAETVELHTVEQTPDGVMKMRPVEQIDVPAGGEQQLKPGGFHVMLLGITRDLNEGETVDLTLVFENAGELTLSLPVQMMPPMPGNAADAAEPSETLVGSVGDMSVRGAWVRAAVVTTDGSEGEAMPDSENEPESEQ